MATKIRLKRFGGKHDPHYRIVIADSRKRRDGSSIEELGYYSPAGEHPTLEVNAERVEHWLATGAQPTETVRSLLVKAGVLEAPAGYEAQEAEGDTEAEAAEAAQEAEGETDAAPEEEADETEAVEESDEDAEADEASDSEEA